MAITLNPVPRRDSRGLPEGFDTETLFQYRYETLAKGAKGVESFLYKYIPITLVKSVTFAIDPTHRFKAAPSTITASNRSRTRSVASVLQQRKRTRMRSQTSWSQDSNYKGISVCSSPDLKYTSVPHSTTYDALASQPALVDEINDTTARTRIIGSTQGELDFFKSTLHSPERVSPHGYEFLRYTNGADADASCRAVGGTPDYHTGSRDIRTRIIGPYGATLSSSISSNLRDSEIAFLQAYAQKEAVSMLKGVSPFSRDYSLTRNLAELKDLPRSIASMQRTADDLRKLYASLTRSPKVRDNIFVLGRNTVSDIPSEYLSYHFGWKQLQKDLEDLLKLPEKLSRRLNFLIARSGKPTTFRTKRNSVSSVSGVSGFVYEANDEEWNQIHSSRVERESELRLVINGTFDFPPINSPKLRQRFFADKVGVIPRFIDVYNIVPWTWLVDWFTGLGNYLELIEEINHDPTLINWGLMTGHSSGKLVTDYAYTTAMYHNVYVNNVLVQDGWVNTNRMHSSVLEFECQIRMNVANILDVKQTAVPTSLTGYQLSILGALLASRTQNTRAGTFSPRS
jgi:hypothetical protein